MTTTAGSTTSSAPSNTSFSSECSTSGPLTRQMDSPDRFQNAGVPALRFSLEQIMGSQFNLRNAPHSTSQNEFCGTKPGEFDVSADGKVLLGISRREGQSQAALLERLDEAQTLLLESDRGHKVILNVKLFEAAQVALAGGGRKASFGVVLYDSGSGRKLKHFDIKMYPSLRCASVSQFFICANANEVKVLDVGQQKLFEIRSGLLPKKMKVGALSLELLQNAQARMASALFVLPEETRKVFMLDFGFLFAEQKHILISLLGGAKADFRKQGPPTAGAEPESAERKKRTAGHADGEPEGGVTRWFKWPSRTHKRP